MPIYKQAMKLSKRQQTKKLKQQWFYDEFIFSLFFFWKR